MGRASLAGAVSAAELGGLAILFAGIPAGALLGWLLLRLARVQRSWAVALVAPLPVLAGWNLLDMTVLYPVRSSHHLSVGPVAAVVAVHAGGYAAAALATAPGVKLGWWRPVIAAALTVVAGLGFTLPGLVATSQRNSRLDDQLRAFGHPLYAPDMPGFRVVNAGSDPILGPGSTFTYQLEPVATNADIGDVRAQQRTVPLGFDPLIDCSTVLMIHDADPVRCVQVAPGLWSNSQSRYVSYVARRGDQIITLMSTGGVSDDDLRKAAMSLHERPLSYFHSR